MRPSTVTPGSGSRSSLLALAASAHGASFCVIFAGALGLGCSWTRYDDVIEKSPIVVLNRPKDVATGFGSSLTTGTDGERVTLLVGGAPLSAGAVEFDLGQSDSPTLDARDLGHCMGSDVPCYLSSSPVTLSRADTPGQVRDLCFVDGAGTASGERGLVVRCADDVEYHLEIPRAADKLLEFSLGSNQPTLFRFGADHAPETAFLATADEERAVWYYPPLSRDFVELPYPGAKEWPEDPNRALAVARVGDGRLLAVGIAESSEVRLYFAPDSKTPSYIGCLGGPAGFGRAFGTGPVLGGDADDELVIADESFVHVFDAARLASLLPTSETGCSLSALPEGSLVSSFGCGSTKNISGCSGSRFGASLAVGDLDGDGDGEVVVGAPSMTVRHIERAGALLIYDVEEPGDALFKDIAFMSSAESDDQLGLSIALPNLGDRQIIAAGAPGNGKAALFYCPSFLPAELEGERCK